MKTIFGGAKFGDRFTNGDKLFIYLGIAKGYPWLCYEEQILEYLNGDDKLKAMCIRGDYVEEYIHKYNNPNDISHDIETISKVLINEKKLADMAEDYALGESDNCGEQCVLMDAFKAGYHKAKEE